jgi:hypothetical protein
MCREFRQWQSARAGDTFQQKAIRPGAIVSEMMINKRYHEATK